MGNNDNKVPLVEVYYCNALNSDYSIVLKTNFTLNTSS